MIEAEPQIPPFTVDEALDLIDQADDKSIELKELRVKYKQLIDQLIAQKDRFQNIYQTEKGSYYFTFTSGETLRFKCQKDTDDSPSYYWPQPIMQQIYGIDGEIIPLETDEHGNIMKIGFKKVPLIQGNGIIEIGILGREEYSCKENDEGLTECTQKPDSIQKNGYQSQVIYHPGHKIINVIK